MKKSTHLAGLASSFEDFLVGLKKIVNPWKIWL